MSLPLIILTGQAGSGKDTVASFLVKNHGAVSIAQADPMKRLAARVFGFTEEQLWGPSAMRNAVDTRLASPDFARVTRNSVRAQSISFSYVRKILPGLGDTAHTQAAEKLEQWIDSVLAYAQANGGASPRYVLQTLGTEWGRNFSRNIWVDWAKRTALELLGGGYQYDRLRPFLVPDESAKPNFVVISDGRFRNELISVLAMGGETWKVTAPDTDGSAALKAGVAGHASEVEQRSIPDHFFTVLFENDKASGLEECERRVGQALQQRPFIQLRWGSWTE